MTIAILQVLHGTQWINVGVFATKELAEIEASRAGYIKWSVSEFGVRGRE